MSERSGSNGGLRDDPHRAADEALGARIGELLRSAGIVAVGDVRSGAEPWELGRLVRAFARVGDPRIRAEIISLLEAIGLLQSENQTLPRP